MTDTVSADAIALGLAFFAFAIIVQAVLLIRLRPRRLVGDEGEYVNTANRTLKNRVWLRVPLFAGIPWLAGQLSADHQVTGARIIVSLISATAVGLASWYACREAGPFAGLFAGLALVFSIERAVLSIHLWPDTALGLCLLLFSIFLGAGSGLYFGIVLGAVAAAGFLTRFDFFILTPFAAIATIVDGPPSVWSLAAITGPTLLAASLLTLRNGRVHGIWAPDTTWAFNLRVAVLEANQPGGTIDVLMAAAARQVEDPGVRDDHRAPLRHFASITCGRPLAVLAQVLQRLHTLMGPETFVSETLIDQSRAGYRPLPNGGATRFALINLKAWVPVVFLLFIAVSPMLEPALLALVALVVATQVVAQTRSRYRMALLPLLAAQSAVGLAARADPDRPTAGLIASVALALVMAVWFVVRAPRREVEPL